MNIWKFALLTLAGAQSLSACDLCAVYSATRARGETGKGFSAGVAAQYTDFGTLQDNGVEVPNEVDQYLRSTIAQLFLNYNVSERLGVQFNLPLINRSYQRPEGFEVEQGTVSGLGDVSLVGHAQLLQLESMKTSFNFTLLGGVTFPTGNTSRLQEEEAELTEPPPPPGAPESGIHGHDLALGSGSYNGLVGAGVFARWENLFLTAHVQYAIRSTGDYDYRYANDLIWLGGPGVFLVFSEEHTLSLQVVVSGETKPQDTFQGEKAEDTGITSVFLGPQLNYTWSDKLSAEVGMDLPVSINNTALQAVPNYRARAALTWHF
jgi:hypothetical protein